MTCGIHGFKPAPLLGAALLVFGSTASAFRPLWGQGVTTAAMSGVVAAKDGSPLADATIVAVPVPPGPPYPAVAPAGGGDHLPDHPPRGAPRVGGAPMSAQTTTPMRAFVS